MSPSPASDINELYQAARSGDRAAESELLETLSARFRLFAYRRVWNDEDAAELVQDALLVVVREYRQLQVEKSFAAWAYQVMENRLLSHSRSQGTRRGVVRQSPEGEPEGTSPDPRPELKRKLMDCLKKVARANRRYARILNLHYQGFTTEEVCGRLGLTANNCYVLLSRARTMLERCLENGDIER